VRILLVSGKGGVGKTTTAAATALACADAGHRTLVLSTDPAHSLADAFGVPLGAEPVAIVPGLVGQQLDPQARLESAWGELRSYLAALLDWAGVAAIEAEELTLLPGVEEAFALADVQAAAAGGDHDVVVVDCAPTAETLRLLSLPEAVSWWMERLFPLGRQVTRVLGPVVGRVSSVPVAGDDVFGAAWRFYERLRAVRALLADPTVTSVRLVVNPERMVVAEARRLATSLALYGYRVDAVVANRLLPSGLADPWFDRWKEVHAEHLASIVEGFAPLPVLTAALAADEVVGVDALRRFGEEVYDGGDPAAHLHHGPTMTVERRDGGWVLSLELPFADREDVRLGRRGGELFVRVGGRRRAILLPDSLRQRPVVDASVRDGVLAVVFAKEVPVGRTGT